MTPRIDPIRASATEHQVRERFGEPAVFGLSFPLPAGFVVEAGRLMLAIAAADGAATAREREACEATARYFGATPEEARAIATFDPRTTPLESLVTDATRALAPLLLYEAVRVARVDGFADKERKATQRAARAIGLDPALVPAIEALLLVDDALQQARHDLLQSPPDLSRFGTGPLLLQGGETRAAEYGVGPGGLPRDVFLDMGKAILVLAAGDGELNDVELRWFVGQARAVGGPEDAVEALLKFDPIGIRIEDAVDERLFPYARGILLDAVRTARADGYHQRERKLARRAAEALRLDPTFVVALENQLLVEDAARAARFRVLAGALP